MDSNLSASRPSSPPPVKFGEIDLAPALVSLREELNREIIGLLRSLPGSAHADAVVFFLQHLGTTFVPVFDYFRRYHAPSWSILHWIAHKDARPSRSPQDDRCARTAHAMALFLHPLDDHLNDGQLPATHLNLLLRSQAWLRMHRALIPLAGGVVDGQATVCGFLDDYYASIATPPPVATLDGYCEHFRKQMATWQIVPVLMARREVPDKSFAAALQNAYGAFGIAWRLLDDLQDIEADRRSDTPSAVYYGLPEDLRTEWHLAAVGVSAGCDRVGDFLATNEIQDAIRTRISHELTSAAETFIDLGMGGLAAELYTLARPFIDGPGKS